MHRCKVRLRSCALLQNVPTVTEVEVNPEGLWRPAQADIGWQSTLEDTAPLTTEQLVKPRLAVKPDPDQASDGRASAAACLL